MPGLAIKGKMDFQSSPAIERFWKRVEKTPTCWLWKGADTGRGYGRIYNEAGRKVRVHRYAYEQFIGPIPLGLQIDHICSNKKCVNPAHLQVVTNKENLRLAVERRGGIHWASH